LEGVGDRYTGAKAKGHATIKIDGGLTFMFVLQSGVGTLQSKQQQKQWINE
jgi:hypothetical protein